MLPGGTSVTGEGRAEAAAATLDLRHLRCPLPALRTRKALRTMAPGAVLVVQCTDPLSEIDIPHLVAQTGDMLVASGRDGDVMIFTIRRR